MRLVSFMDGGVESLGVMTGDRITPTQSYDGAPRTMAELLATGDPQLVAFRSLIAALPQGLPPTVAVADVTLLPPVSHAGKIVCVGRNYPEHADEEGVERPATPLIFAKFPSALVGHQADIVWDPSVTSSVDYEAELAVVIGQRVRNLATEEALSAVLGYMCLNDVSARDIQFGESQWTRGKSLDTFCPTGPALVTKDEIPDPGILRIRCLVNGKERQQALTSEMLFSVAEIIAFCSRHFTLEPGDIVATGTPPGVGIFRDPPQTLTDGDEVVVEIERVGRLVNRCRFASAPSTTG